MDLSGSRRLAVAAAHLKATPVAGDAVPSGSPVLKGVRVVELATVVAAPAATALFADFGADVIKVEAPSGDYFRSEGKALEPGREHGKMFDNFNRGKRSIVLDLTKDSDRAHMEKLVRSADVFVTNVRPEPLKRLGLDYDTLKTSLPRLVYAQLTAWGLEGPMKDEPGYDAGAFFAATGMQDLLRPSEDSPPPRYPGAFGDLATSMQLVSGIALALFHRERCGEGQLVDASLLRQGIWMLGCPLTMQMVPKRGPLTSKTVRGDRKGVFNPVFNTYKSSDGRWFQLLGLEIDRHFPKVMGAMGLAATIKADERFSSTKGILKNKAALVDIMDARFAEKTLEAWQAVFDAAGVWYTVTKRYEDVINDPQAIAAGAFTDVPGVDQRLIASPVKLSCAPHQPKGPGPDLGQHTQEVLDEL